MKRNKMTRITCLVLSLLDAPGDDFHSVCNIFHEEHSFR